MLKDFLNLSNGGGRFIKATQDARRQANGGANAGVGPSSQTKISGVQNQTTNNFYANGVKTPA